MTKLGETKVGGRLLCTYCGEKGTKDEPLVWGPNPYDEDTHNDPTPCWMHDHCRDDAAQDI